MAINSYSPLWFRSFLDPYPPEKTAAQLEFIKRQLPLPKSKRVLDVCSGPGRVAGPLSRAGYEVTAVDKDPACIAEGQRLHPAARFSRTDMKDVAMLGREYDGILCLWQSFGFFEEDQNRQVLRAFAGLLAPGGKVILDLYDRRYFEAHQGTVTQSIGGRSIRQQRTMDGNRLLSRLDYGDGKSDDFDWELFTPREMVEVADRASLKAVLLCCDFDEKNLPGEGKPSFQVVLTQY